MCVYAGFPAVLNDISITKKSLQIFKSYILLLNVYIIGII